MRFWTLVMVMSMVAVSGCAPSSSTSGPGGSDSTGAKKSKGTIGVSVLTTSNPFFVKIGDTIRDQAAKQGYETIVVSGERDADRQHNQVKDFIVKKVAAIVLTPCNSKAVGTAIREANAAGIPVFTADIACLAPDAKVVCHVATDNYGGGREAAKAMVEALSGKGKVAIIDFPEVESVILRTRGFDDQMAEENKKPGVKVEVVSRLSGGGLKDPGYKAAQDLLQAHGDLAGIFAINDPSALGAVAALENAGKAGTVKVIGFDGQIDGKRAILEGKIYADPIQFPDRIAEKTVEVIVQHFRGEPVPPEVLIPTRLYRKADAAADPELKGP